MRAGALWKISVSSPAEAEEAVGELLGRTFHENVSSWHDLDSGLSTATVYFRSKPALPARWRRSLAEEIRRMGEFGICVEPLRISFGRVKREDWAESWKRHFRPLEIGSALLVKPSWSRRRPRAGQAVVVLDPGLSFGTGQHPTTSFCLHRLAASRRLPDGREPAGSPSFLDAGTGSGILAIAAAKLGYAPVHAFDFDPEAVRLAGENAIANGVRERIRIVRRDVTKLPVRSARRYSLICANLVANLLIAGRERILARLDPGGALVLAGILEKEFDQVERAYRSAGLCLETARTEGEWRSGAFRWAGA
jgi:ribosomal protein L11 methyltransferase